MEPVAESATDELPPLPRRRWRWVLLVVGVAVLGVLGGLRLVDRGGGGGVHAAAQRSSTASASVAAPPAAARLYPLSAPPCPSYAQCVTATYLPGGLLDAVRAAVPGARVATSRETLVQTDGLSRFSYRELRARARSVTLLVQVRAIGPDGATVPVVSSVPVAAGSAVTVETHVGVYTVLVSASAPVGTTPAPATLVRLATDPRVVAQG